MTNRSPGPGFDMRHVRSMEQKRQMEQIAAEGICPFCPEHLERTHRAPIEWRGPWWSVTKNDYPYEGAKLHYLFVYNRHLETMAEVTPEAFAELMGHLQRIVREQAVPGGTFFMRFGDSGHTGATVAHLHAHLVVGAGADDSSEKLKITAGYKMPG